MSTSAGRVILESLRLDFDPEEAVRERAETAIALGVGGFIVFGGERGQVADLVADLRARARQPLWFGADLERGPGQQFAGLPTLPPPAGLAAHPEPEEAARLAGGITARGAHSVGIDLVFAPVLDLDVEPDNPIVGTRSFGHDPVTVARLAGAWIEACQQNGVVACAKHFPGHGRTTADSHAEIPVVTTQRHELEADLLPFRRLAGRAGAMLTAHVAYPTLGVDVPATLSPELLTGVLREEMGFTGMIVTDAMNMSGFLDAEAEGEGAPAPTRDPAVMALLAGCDLLLYPDDLVATLDALDAAAAVDERVAARLEEAVARSDEVRARFVKKSGLLGGRIPSVPDPRGRSRDRRGSVAGRTTSGQRTSAGEPGEPVRRGTDPGRRGTDLPDSDTLHAAAISMLTIQRRGDLPEWLRAGRPIRVIAIWDDREMQGRLPFGSRFVDELRESGWQAALADPEDQPERIPSIVLIAATPQAWKGTAGLTESGRARAEHALANPSGALPVVFGHRRLLEKLGGTGVCAWGTEPALELFAARKLVADARAGQRGTATAADSDDSAIDPDAPADGDHA